LHPHEDQEAIPQDAFDLIEQPDRSQACSDGGQRYKTLGLPACSFLKDCSKVEKANRVLCDEGNKSVIYQVEQKTDQRIAHSALKRSGRQGMVSGYGMDCSAIWQKNERPVGGGRVGRRRRTRILAKAVTSVGPQTGEHAPYDTGS
jgi:hypothetical protein